jgi:hypothetical protein
VEDTNGMIIEVAGNSIDTIEIVKIGREKNILTMMIHQMLLRDPIQKEH